MENHDLLINIVLIFAGATLFATLALVARLPIIIAYIIPGFLFGPYVLNWIEQPEAVESASHIGILFLLFLLGLDLQPSHLLHLLKKTAFIGFSSCAIFFVIGFSLSWWAFGFSLPESFLTGAALMFSSTIIGIKLLPTSSLHHKHIGEVVVSLLLLQDIIAILVLVVISGSQSDNSIPLAIILRCIAFAVLLGGGYLVVKHLLIPLLARFDRIREFLFLAVIGWCMLMAWFSHVMGLSWEIGAFVAGVTLAVSPLAQYVADQLKPLRDFFLVLFFFSVGAHFNPSMFGESLWMLIALTAAVLISKPLVFRGLFHIAHETPEIGREVGARLGQISEFSLLIILLGSKYGLLSEEAMFVLTGTTLACFAISSWKVVNNFHSPIATKPHLLKD